MMTPAPARPAAPRPPDRPGLASRVLARAGALLLAAALLPAAARAQSEGGGLSSMLPAGLRITGFGTLGLTHHDNGDVGLATTYSQRHPAYSGVSGRLDTVLGLQADLRLGDATSATLQAAARAGDGFRPKLRMAYLRQGLGADLALRAGRLRSPVFLDSDVSEIGFAYLMVRPPLPLYGVAANNFQHLDGLDLQWRRRIGSSALLLQAFGGEGSYRQVFFNLAGEPEGRGRFQGVRGLSLSLALPDITVRASKTWVERFTLRSAQFDQLDAGLLALSGALAQTAQNPLLPAQAAAGLSAQSAALAGLVEPFKSKVAYTSLGGDATLGPWRLLGEWAAFDSGSAMIGRYRGWQATVGHVIGNVTPYVGFSANVRRTPLLDTRALSATGLDATLDAGLAQLKTALDAAVLMTDISTRSSAVGLRWDWTDTRVLKLQLEELRSRSATAPGLFAVRSLPIDPKVRLLSLTLDFIF